MSVDPNAPVPNAPAAPAAPLHQRLGYASDEELERAVYHSRAEGTRLAAELAERDRAQEFERTLPSQRAAERRDPTAELATLGIPTDALNDYVTERISNALAPIVQTNAAMSRVKASNPDFARFETDWQQWLSSHPDINNRLQDALTADPRNADFTIQGVFSMFERERRSAAPEAQAPPVPSNAMLPQTQGSGGGRGAEAQFGPTPEQMNELLLRARRGDQRAQIDLIRSKVGPQPHPELPPVT